MQHLPNEKDLIMMADRTGKEEPSDSEDVSIRSYL